MDKIRAYETVNKKKEERIEHEMKDIIEKINRSNDYYIIADKLSNDTINRLLADGYGIEEIKPRYHKRLGYSCNYKISFELGAKPVHKKPKFFEIMEAKTDGGVFSYELVLMGMIAFVVIVAICNLIRIVSN